MEDGWSYGWSDDGGWMEGWIVDGWMMDGGRMDEGHPVLSLLCDSLQADELRLILNDL